MVSTAALNKPSVTALATTFGAIIMATVAKTSHGQSIESCPAGATVSSLTFYHGYWLDKMYMTCTDGTEAGPFPPQGRGNELTADMCADTDGVESVQWFEASGQPFLRGNSPLVYVTVTCLDGTTYLMANDIPIEDWSVSDAVGVASCDQGESVSGLTWDAAVWQYEDGDTYQGQDVYGEYVITNIGLRCSPTGLVDARERTTVTQDANAYDKKTSPGGGCDPIGCTPELTRDRNLRDASRWSCRKQINGSKCKIKYNFEEPQDIVRLSIKFYKGDERVRKLKLKGSGGFSKTITSSGSSTGYESFEINTDETAWLSMEPVDLKSHEWISIIEAQFLVK